MEKELTREEAIKKALEFASSGNEIDMNEAILILKKAKVLPNQNYYTSNDLLSIYAFFLEAELSIGSTKDNFASFLLGKVSFSEGYNLRPYFYYIQENPNADLNFIKSKSPKFSDRITSFLNYDLGKIWVKSLKFDALKSQIEKWQLEDKLDSDRMKKIREILGE